MRRATIRTTHEDAATAERIAAAVEPDNTEEMRTSVDDDTVVTTIDRETTRGLQSTADDYVVNLHVAAQCANQDGDTSTNAGATTRATDDT